MRSVGSLAGNGCAGSVVVFFDGSKTLGSRMWRSKGQILVFAKVDIIVLFFSEHSLAFA